MDVFCVPSFFCLHHPDWAHWVLCLISMLHSVMLLLGLRSCWLLMLIEKGERVNSWWMSFVCLLSSQHRSSSVSVVFDFNDSLNGAVPVSLKSFPIYVMIIHEWIADGSLLCVFFCLHYTDRVQWVLCLISVIHSMMLPQCLQWCCLSMRIEMIIVIC